MAYYLTKFEMVWLRIRPGKRKYLVIVSSLLLFILLTSRSNTLVGTKEEAGFFRVENMDLKDKCLQAYHANDYANLSGYNIPRLSYEGLPRSLTEKEYYKVRDLIRDVDVLFTENNMTYTLAHGTLLGSYLMHDLLPWDEDLDVWTSSENLVKIMDIFYKKRYRNMEASLRQFRSFTVLKISHTDGEVVGHSHMSWKWPYVDVLFLTENQTHLVTTMVSTHIVIDKADFFPIVRRPFMSMWLPSPYSPITILSRSYTKFAKEFTNGRWNHKREAKQHKLYVSAKSVVPYYPAVHRVLCEGTDLVEESLHLNNSKLYSVLVRQSNGPMNSLYKQWYPFL